MSFSLIILGSSSAVPTSDRFPPAHLLNVDERFYLIDCGEGVQMQLRRFGIRFGRINHIFISHLHGDHVFGLFGLLSSFSLMGRSSDLNIYGPQSLEELLNAHFSFFNQERKYSINFHKLTGKTNKRIFEDERITVDAFPLRHSTQCYGFLFREKEKLRNIRKEAITRYEIPIRAMMAIKQGEDFVDGSGNIIPNEELTVPPPRPRAFAYCSDTMYFPALARRVQDVDLLYHEATFLKKDQKLARETMHSTAYDAAVTAANANARHLVIGHFSTRYKTTDGFVKDAIDVFPDVHEALDGFRYRIEQNGNLVVEPCREKK